MSTYRIGDKTFSEDSDALQAALAAIYDTDVRPRCMCTPEGVPMYVSQFSKLVIKRMPDSGCLHDPTCDSFEIADAQSGLGLHAGDAIVRLANGRLQVRLGFALTRYQGQPIRHAIGRGISIDAVAASKPTLTIGALLQLLWDEAGFNQWSPKMHGKRRWGLIRHFLLQAANDIDAKGGPLADHLLIPEPFRKSNAEEIDQRLAQQLAKLDPPRAGVHPMLVLLGELKHLEHTPAGGRIAVKHLPNLPLHADQDLMKRVKRHFGAALEAFQTGAGARLVIACTVRKANDRHAVETLTLLMVNKDWIPVDNRFELVLADALIAAERSFIKVLRYGAPEKHLYANFVLRDTGEQQATMDIVVESKDRDASAAKEALIAQRPPGAWVWRTNQSLHMPALPPKRARGAAGPQASAPTSAAQASEQAPELSS